MSRQYQCDEDPPLLGHRNEEEDDYVVGYGYCEARSNFFHRFQMAWKGNYELQQTLILKHPSMTLSKGTYVPTYIYVCV